MGGSVLHACLMAACPGGHGKKGHHALGAASIRKPTQPKSGKIRSGCSGDISNSTTPSQNPRGTRSGTHRARLHRRAPLGPRLHCRALIGPRLRCRAPIRARVRTSSTRTVCEVHRAQVGARLPFLGPPLDCTVGARSGPDCAVGP